MSCAFNFVVCEDSYVVYFNTIKWISEWFYLKIVTDAVIFEFS